MKTSSDTRRILHKGDWQTWSGEMLVVPLFEPEGENKDKLSELSPQALNFDSKVDGALSEMISNAELKGKVGTSSTIRLSRSAPVITHALSHGLNCCNDHSVHD